MWDVAELERGCWMMLVDRHCVVMCVMYVHNLKS